MIRLGIDIGGSALKAALVNLETGQIVSEKVRVKHAKDHSPEKVLEGFEFIKQKLAYTGPIGIGFPGRIRKNVMLNAPNLHPEWTNLDLLQFFGNKNAEGVAILNDADAAALAEVRIGNPALQDVGQVLFLTLGTGIGSAFIFEGKIWLGTELGHLRVNDLVAEKYAAASIKNIENLSWAEWGVRLNAVLQTYDFLFNPDCFVLGGAISSNLVDFQSYLDFPEDKVIAAKLGNDAGIIGAALATQN